MNGERVFIEPNDMKVGTPYKVEMLDCCINGEFTSMLVKALRTDDGYVDQLTFENGVVFGLFMQCTFEEVG